LKELEKKEPEITPFISVALVQNAHQDFNKMEGKGKNK